MKSWGYQSCMFLMGGNLNNGDQAGSAYVNLNNGPGNANWNIAARENGNTFLTGCHGGNNPSTCLWRVALPYGKNEAVQRG